MPAILIPACLWSVWDSRVLRRAPQMSTALHRSPRRYKSMRRPSIASMGWAVASTCPLAAPKWFQSGPTKWLVCAVGAWRLPQASPFGAPIEPRVAAPFSPVATQIPRVVNGLGGSGHLAVLKAQLHTVT